MLPCSRRLYLKLVVASALLLSHEARATDAVEPVPQKVDALQKPDASQKEDVEQKCVEMRWETTVENRTRTVYENVEETKEKIVYDTHYDTKTVHDVHHVAEFFGWKSACVR